MILGDDFAGLLFYEASGQARRHLRQFDSLLVAPSQKPAHGTAIGPPRKIAGKVSKRAAVGEIEGA